MSFEPSPRQTHRPAPGGKDSLRILLVEDHSDTKVSMEILLRRAGHSVQSAERARDAIALAAQHEFDLVITDIGLPDMGGVELMKRLNDDYGLTAIGTSGYGGDSSLLPEGPPFIHHLTKPINMEELRSLLTEFSAMKRQDS